MLPVLISRKSETAKFTVRGMTCAACSSTITQQLQSTPGIFAVSVSLLTERMEATFDPSLLSPASLLTAVGNIGYEASVIDDEKPRSVEFDVEGMTCSACVGTLSRVLSGSPGVLSAHVILLPQGKASVAFDPTKTTVRGLIEVIERAGFDAHVKAADGSAPSSPLDEGQLWLRRFLFSMVFSVPVFILSMVLNMWVPSSHKYLHAPVHRGLTVLGLTLVLLTTPVQFGAGWAFHRGAYYALRARSANMDVLVVLGTNAAYWYSFSSVLIAWSRPGYMGGEFFEASALLITFLSLGKYLEFVAKRKTSDALRALMQLQPATAVVVTLGIDGEIVSEKTIAGELLAVGDVVKVAPGDRVPSDGIVLNGSSHVDEKMITGESRPVLKVPGDEVIGGTVNVSSALRVKVSRVGKDTAISQIAKLIEDAQSSKAPIEAVADRISRYFVPVILVLSLVTFIVWISLSTSPGVLPKHWIPMNSNPTLFSLTFAVSVLVIACPCALGLATPTAVMVATGVGARYGVLIKGGAALESGRTVTAIIFDKTGTLTEGKPRVNSIISPTGSVTPATAATVDLSLISLIASAEHGSSHPIASAVTDLARTVGATVREPSDFEVIDGQGIRCTVDRRRVCLGNRTLLLNERVDLPVEVANAASAQERTGATVIFAVADGSLLGALAIGDALKADAKTTVAHLKKMGVAIYMVTGDHVLTARAVAAEVGIDHVFADVLPRHKADMVTKLKGEGHIVAMVGDGINDSPALAASDIGIAIGAGSDVAIETAGIVLMGKNLAGVVTAIDLARAAYRRILINFFWAFIFNLTGIPLAMGIFFPLIKVALPPWMAGMAMASSSVTVVASSLLLKRYAPPNLLGE